MNIQDWFPLGWTGWISLQSKGLSRVFSNTTVQKHHFTSTSLQNELVDTKCLEEWVTSTYDSLNKQQTIWGHWRDYQAISQNALSKKSSPETSGTVLDSDVDKEKVLDAQSCPILCDPWTVCWLPGPSVHGILPAKNTEVDCLFQGVFLTQGSNLGLLHCRQILYCLIHQGSPIDKAKADQLFFDVNNLAFFFKLEYSCFTMLC